MADDIDYARYDRIRPIRWTGTTLELLDQRKLPFQTGYLDCHDSDEVAARNNPHTFLNLATVDSSFDFNRDGFINATDQILARSNSTTLATSLKLISVPGSLQAAVTSSPSLPIANLTSITGTRLMHTAIFTAEPPWVLDMGNSGRKVAGYRTVFNPDGHGGVGCGGVGGCCRVGVGYCCGCCC